MSISHLSCLSAAACMWQGVLRYLDMDKIEFSTFQFIIWSTPELQVAYSKCSLLENQDWLSSSSWGCMEMASRGM